MTTTDDFEKLVYELNLAASEDALFIGRVSSFPIGVKAFTNGESTVLLFQIRFPKRSDPPGTNIKFSDRINTLLENRSLEIEFEETIVWLNFPDVSRLSESPAELLREVLIRLADAGLNRTLDLCHYCAKEAVTDLTSFDGKVAQICRDCLQSRTQPILRSNSPLTIIPVLLFGIASVPFGAAGWISLWIALDALFGWLQTSVVVVPRIIGLLGLACAAGLAGGPAGWAIGRVRTRTLGISAAASVLAVGFAVGLGEILYVTWLLYRETHALSPELAIRLLPKFWSDLHLNLLLRILAAMLAAITAFTISRPQKEKVHL